MNRKWFFDLCIAKLNGGQHKAPDDFPRVLAEGFYHRPQRSKEEFVHAGLNVVEGVIRLDSQFFGSMRHLKRRKTLIELIEATEMDTCLLAVQSAHNDCDTKGIMSLIAKRNITSR